mmetsp:Transcript_19618/g.54680  ORF Transcript_19618/g.54680 Transcript_19618/m.54680 type:complete len:151 (+) Transcript_19618:329-781(+)
MPAGPPLHPSCVDHQDSVSAWTGTQQLNQKTQAHISPRFPHTPSPNLALRHAHGGGFDGAARVGRAPPLAYSMLANPNCAHHLCGYSGHSLDASPPLPVVPRALAVYPLPLEALHTAGARALHVPKHLPRQNCPCPANWSLQWAFGRQGR